MLSVVIGSGLDGDGETFYPGATLGVENNGGDTPTYFDFRVEIPKSYVENLGDDEQPVVNITGGIEELRRALRFLEDELEVGPDA